MSERVRLNENPRQRRPGRAWNVLSEFVRQLERDGFPNVERRRHGYRPVPQQFGRFHGLLAHDRQTVILTAAERPRHVRLRIILKTPAEGLRTECQNGRKQLGLHARRAYRGRHRPGHSRDRRVLGALRILSGCQERFVENERPIGVFGHIVRIRGHGEFREILRRPRFRSRALRRSRVFRRIPDDAHLRRLEPTGNELFGRKSGLDEIETQSREIQGFVVAGTPYVPLPDGTRRLRSQIGVGGCGGRIGAIGFERKETGGGVRPSDGHRRCDRHRLGSGKFSLPHPGPNGLRRRGGPREKSVLPFPYRSARGRRFFQRSGRTGKPVPRIRGTRHRQQHALLPLEFEHDLGDCGDDGAFRIPHLQSLGILREDRGLSGTYRRRVPLGERTRWILGRIRWRRRHLRMYRTQWNLPCFRMVKALWDIHLTHIRSGMM